MISDGHTETKPAGRVTCPACGQKGKPVSTVTLAALLHDEFAGRFTADRHSCYGTNGEGCQPLPTNTGWRFCDAQDCDVVYYCEENNTIYTKSQLKVPVGVKERRGDRPLCYCFGHSVASIKEELRTKGRTTALEDIRAKMKNPGCRCATENPSGACCLGSVARGIKIAWEELSMENSAVQTCANPAPLYGAAEGRAEHENQVATSSDSACASPASKKGAALATLGAVLTAILGSACCWLPLLLLAFGFSAVGLGSFFEQYRPYFLIATFTLLSVAWYFTYRTTIRRAWARLSGKPAPVAAVEACCVSETTAASHSCCAIESELENCCASAKTLTRRFTVRQFNTLMLGIVTILILLFAMFPHWIGLFLGGKANTAINSDDQQQVVLEVQGMSCPGCAVVIEKSLRAVPGVSRAFVRYEKSEAVVVVPQGQPIPCDAILQAVRQAGYSARFKE